jgi:putative transposase
MDESYSWAAVRYVERNPVAAKMVARAEDYPWGSAPARCGMKVDPLLTSEWPPTTMIEDWSTWLGGPPDIESERHIRKLTFTGRPCGSDEFVKRAEAITGRLLAPQKPGPKSGVLKTEETTPLLWEE